MQAVLAGNAAKAEMAGQRLSTAWVERPTPHQLSLKLPGDLNCGKALLGLVPMAWCAAAWTICLREGLWAQRWASCTILSALAAISVALLCGCAGTRWVFNFRRRMIHRRRGLFHKTFNGRALAGIRLRQAGTGSEAELELCLVSATGRVVCEVARWARRDVDRAGVESIAEEIALAMRWPAPVGANGLTPRPAAGEGTIGSPG